MTWQVICSDSDKEQWKEVRRQFVTGSDAKLWAQKRGLIRLPTYIKESWEDIFVEKKSGQERVFRTSAHAALAHGRESEADAMRKGGMMLGLPYCPYHFFVRNDRWPFIGATLDGVGMVQMLYPPDFSFARRHDPSDRWTALETYPQVLDTHSRLMELHAAGVERVVYECKITDSHSFQKRGEPRAWVDGLPDMHLPQLWTQMAIVEIPYAIILGQLGATNMTAYFVKQNPQWVHEMDKMNTIAQMELAA